MNALIRRSPQLKSVSLAALTMLAVSACTPSGPKSPSGSSLLSAFSGSTGSSGSSSSSSSSNIETYRTASGVKVAFNKNNFYNNEYPNSSGCAGDAKYFFDPQTDRQVPIKPNWLKNIAVEVTNSNARKGPSRASCSLSGVGSAYAANCAFFDDHQILDGTTVRSVLAGGYGCAPGGASCAANSTDNFAASDIWHLNTSDVATGHSWAKQTAMLPTFSADTSTSLLGVAWHAGAYDILHDEYYVFGGSAASGAATFAGPKDFSSAVVRIKFNSDGSAATSPIPERVRQSKRRFYGGWRIKDGAKLFNTSLGLSGIAQPTPRTGSSFTYSSHRDPTMKGFCSQGDDINDGSGVESCSTTTLLNRNAYSWSEHSDYFLLVGGMQTSGLFAPDLYVYKPHGLSYDLSTSVEADGDWNLVSNITAYPSDLSSQIMSIVDITTSAASSSVPFVPTFVGQARPSGVTDIFTGWVGHAYHRTVYDPTMNRYYIFGGLVNNGAMAGAPVSAITTAPDLASNEVWIYDPPAIGRRPTAACFTKYTPDVNLLPLGTTGFANSVITNLDVNRNYWASNFVFPPGGCLQRVLLPTAPTARFEHSMAFDTTQKAVVVFGGCTQPSTIPGSGSTQGGDPLGVPGRSCTTTSALQNDVWLYLPPTITEIVPQSGYTSTSDSPYYTNRLLGNIFGTDFWLDRLPIFSDSNATTTLTQPTTDQALGTWIQMSFASGAVKPTPRVSASLVYDRAHRKFLLFGGYGCTDSTCTAMTQALNDLWEYTPPDIQTYCSRTSGTCSASGTWVKVKDNKAEEPSFQPPLKYGATMDLAQPMFSYGDDHYTVLDTACVGQGPISSGDSSVNKRLVGAIYIDIDRDELGSSQNLLINLRFLPFDESTRMPGLLSSISGVTVDDTDKGSSNDVATIRVQLMSNAMRTGEQISSSVQPRFHEFISGTPIIADTLMYVSGPSGQITEKQIHVPLKLDSSVNMIKIERVQGSVKFYEMTVTKF